MDQNGSSAVARLILSAAGRQLRDIALDRPRLMIGRRTYCHVLLNDLTVSGEHAEIRTVNGISTIRDLKSRNGTMVNGRSVHFSALKDGDRIDIGIYRFTVRMPGRGGATSGTQRTESSGESLPAGRSARIASLERASLRITDEGAAPEHAVRPDDGYATDAVGNSGHIASPGDGRAAQAGDDAPMTVMSDDLSPAALVPQLPSAMVSAPSEAGDDGAAIDAAPDMQATLIHLSGPMAPMIQAIDRPIVSVRNGSGQVAVVARRHAGYYLTHVEGSAYPLVNGESIGLSAHELREGDLVELSGMILQFMLDAPD